MNEMLDFVPESPAWFAWLDEAPSFTFQGKTGAYTARKESIRQGDAYWYAYVRSGEKLLKKYVGKTGEVTLARLELYSQTSRAGLESAFTASRISAATGKPGKVGAKAIRRCLSVECEKSFLKK